MKEIIKNLVRPSYYFLTRNLSFLKTQITKTLLPKAFAEELVFFEDIRNQSYNDQEYASKRFRMLTHWIDKTFTLSKKINKAVTVKQVEDMMPVMERKRNSDLITCQWAGDVLDYYNGVNNKAEPQPNLCSDAPELLFDIIKTRRSIRSFKKHKIENDILDKILEAGLWSPSGCNRQSIEYLVVDDPQQVIFCQKYAGEYYSFPQEASVNIVILVDPRGYALPRQRHMAYLEGGAAIQNILLMAHSLGLGSCWMFWAKHDHEFNKRFSLSSWLLPVGLVCIGYTDKHPPIVPKRKSLSDCLHDVRINSSDEK